MGAEACQRCEDDACQGGTERHMDDVVFREMLGGEEKGEDRHDDDTAADTEEAGEDSCKGAEQDIR